MREGFGFTVLVVGCLLITPFAYAASIGAALGPLPDIELRFELLGYSSDQMPTGPFAAWNPGDVPRMNKLLGDPNMTKTEWLPPILAPVTTYDFDGDKRHEIIVHGDDQAVYVFDLNSGSFAGGVKPAYPENWTHLPVRTPVAAARLGSSEAPSLVVPTPAGGLSAWSMMDRSKSGDLWFEERWQTRLDKCEGDPRMGGGVVVRDVDADGSAEVFAQTTPTGLYALHSNGTVRWQQCWSGGDATPILQDVDGDGGDEIIFASHDGQISVFDPATGDPEWRFDLRSHPGFESASIRVAPTVTELDGRAPREVVVAATGDQHMLVAAIHRDPLSGQPKPIWARELDWAHPGTRSPLIVADVDFDGRPDILGADHNGRNEDLDGETLGPVHVFRLAAKGDDVWQQSIESNGAPNAVVLGDSDGNGVADLLVHGLSGKTPGVWRLTAKTGAREGFLSVPDWMPSGAPHVFTLRPDRVIQLLLPIQPTDTTVERGAVVVVELSVRPRVFRDA